MADEADRRACEKHGTTYVQFVDFQKSLTPFTTTVVESFACGCIEVDVLPIPYADFA